VVVDDVEDDADAVAMGLVDEAPAIVGRTVESRRRVPGDAVVAPAVVAVEIIDRHHFDERDADLLQMRQFLHRRGPRSFGRERADMEFIDDLPREFHAGPCRVFPFVGVRIDHLRRAMNALRLEARCGVWKHAVVAVDAIAVEVAGTGLGNLQRVVTAPFAFHRQKLTESPAIWF
jgi:hypothetical protein